MATSSSTARRKRALMQNLRVFGLAIASLVFLLYVLAPVAWLVSSSLQQEAALTSVPPQWIPKDPHVDNFRIIFSAEDQERVTYETRRAADPASGDTASSTAFPNGAAWRSWTSA